MIVTKYTGSKKYRTNWTVEPDASRGHGVHWFKGDYDGDPLNTCDTIEEAESAIDDAIITEQEQVIDKLRTALIESTNHLDSCKSTLDYCGYSTHVYAQQIEENQRIIKSYEV